MVGSGDWGATSGDGSTKVEKEISNTTYTNLGFAINHDIGRSVSLDHGGTRLAVGAPGNHAVHIFKRSGTSWSREQRLATGGAFGGSVSLNRSSTAADDGRRLAVGAARDDTGATDAVSGLCLQKNNDGIW